MAAAAVQMSGSGWNALMWAAGMPQASKLIQLLVADFGVDPNRRADNGADGADARWTCAYSANCIQILR